MGHLELLKIRIKSNVGALIENPEYILSCQDMTI